MHMVQRYVRKGYELVRVKNCIPTYLILSKFIIKEIYPKKMRLNLTPIARCIAYHVSYIVSIAPSLSFIRLPASCLFCSLDVARYALKNKTDNMRNNFVVCTISRTSYLCN